MEDGAKLDDDHKREYIRAVIGNLDALRTLDLLYVTFNLGAILLITTNIVFNENVGRLIPFVRLVLVISLFFFAIASVLFFIWVRLLQTLRHRAIDTFVTLEIDRLRETHYPGEKFWKS